MGRRICSQDDAAHSHQAIDNFFGMLLLAFAPVFAPQAGNYKLAQAFAIQTVSHLVLLSETFFNTLSKYRLANFW